MSKRLDNRVALITGGGGALGRATARRFAEEGASVVIADIDETAANAAAVDLGERAAAICCDHTSRIDCEAAVAVAIDRFGGLDVLFNNAGIGWTGSFALADEGAIHRVLDADLVGPMKMTQAALPALRTAAAARADGAAIVFTASGLGLHGRAMISLYSVAKHGIIGLARSLALELGQENIRVNAVCPGIVDTQMVRNTTGAWGEVDTVLERFRQSTPLQRNAEPIDIANAALFLASAEARMITGTALLVDGGNHEA